MGLPPTTRQLHPGGQAWRHYTRNWRDWLILAAAAALVAGLLFVAVDYCAGETLHFEGTVEDRHWRAGYTSHEVHTDKDGKVYTSEEWHPPRYWAVVRTWEGIEQMSVSQADYYDLRQGQQVPLQRQVGRWTGWHYSPDLD